MKHWYVLPVALLLVGIMVPQNSIAQQVTVIESSRQNTSAPLRTLSPTETSASKGVQAPYVVPNKFMKFDSRSTNSADKTGFSDPVRQLTMGSLAPSVTVNIDGASADDNSAVLGFRSVPPDTDGDVGPNHYVQMINTVSEIFDKNGNSLVGPFPNNLFWQGLGGDCEFDNDGDPVVLYDERADRWLVSQFAITASPFSMCIAISQTSDPTGAYYQYEFDFDRDFPDYPKLGIWGDSYTMTTRDFRNGRALTGLSAIAMDRTAMLNGNPATLVKFEDGLGNGLIDGYLPADHDGNPTGPAIFGGHGDDGNTTFELWALDVDWSNPGAATLTSLPGVTVSAFDGVVPSVDQPNGQPLDDHSFFTMHRLNARDFGTHTSMVVNHTVETSPGTAGIRWYEFRNSGSGWTLHQEGTFSPDTDDRWMGSMAINANGDIALGYSRSSSTLFPSIYFTGQTADQSGTGIMNVTETLIVAGTGAQENDPVFGGGNRWGDYSRMAVDPSDNVSFWYATEYYKETNAFDYNTRIAKFQLDGSGGGNIPPVAAFSFSATDLVVTFTDASTDADGSVVSWSWDFGDGNSSSIQSPAHTYASAGTYTVGLTVTDDAGSSNTTSQSVTVVEPGVNAPPVAAFTFSTAGLTADFSDTSTDADGSVVSWSWDFGDGNSSTLQNPSHTYAAAGTYTAGLTVTDNEGATGSTSASVTVSDISGGTMSIASIAISDVPAPGVRGRFGQATVTVVDNTGAAVDAATVSGEFYDLFAETPPAALTDASGIAVFVSTTTAGRGGINTSLEFCINALTHPTLTYDPGANADPLFDCTNAPNAGVPSSPLTAQDALDALNETPEVFTLEQNYPNPFNPTTIITFGLPESSEVTVRVYNLLGQVVATLADGHYNAGQHNVSFNADNMSAGVYVYTIETPTFIGSKRMTLLK